MTSVLIGDHVPLTRDGIRRALEQLNDVTVVGEAADALTLVELATKLHPDVVVVDVDIKQFAIPETVRGIRAAGEEIKILVLTLRDEPQIAQRMLGQGAAGYLLKGIDSTGLQEVFRILMMGERIIDRTIESRLARLSTANSGSSSAVTNPPSTALTERDLQLLHWMADGSSNAEVAKSLGVAERTAKGYISAVFAKLGATSRLEAIVNAARSGLLKL